MTTHDSTPQLLDMSDSDSSPLSSALSSPDEDDVESVSRSMGLEKYFKRVKPESPPPPKRAPSPPHEYVLADNPDIAFIVMFRERFNDVFPKSLPNYGPQEIERGVSDIVPGDHIERLLCALLGLVLNRKKDVERGHYQRALEEAVQTHSAEWPRSWEGKNPLHGGKTFTSMSPEERLGFLRALILWALTSSEAVQNMLKDGYKLTRHDRDRNSSLAVQPWGHDTWKRRYWLIEGRDDTHFRLYRESNPALKTNTWWSVAGSIPEIKAVADNLAAEKARAAKELSKKIHETIPRFEASEEKRKRRDYRLARKAAFSRPENGMSLYEGRTRGKRIKYTFSDEEADFSSDAIPSRKSTRFQSSTSTPGEPAGPVFTASGRQVRSRIGGAYGESMLTGRRSSADHNEGAQQLDDSATRTRAGARTNGWTEPGAHIQGYNSIDEMDDEPDAVSSGDDYDEAEANFADDDEEMSEAQSMDEDDMDIRPSLVVQLRYGKGKQVPTAGAYPSPPAGPRSDIVTDEKPPPSIAFTEPPKMNGFAPNTAPSATLTQLPPNPNAFSKPPPVPFVSGQDNAPVRPVDLSPQQPPPPNQQNSESAQNGMA